MSDSSSSEMDHLSFAAIKDAARAERVLQGESRQKDRADRATTEQVLDPRTRLILFKLIANGVFAKIDGCLSTGKEANVYFARRGPEAEASFDLAVKVYKTSILVFRDRERYVDGEHRFRRGYAKAKNPRKMVRLWAEKELRNYKRLVSAGVRAPRPVLLKANVLAMEFIGDDGWPAPRLKDTGLEGPALRAAYKQTMRAMRALYRRCRLVHGDLSEYNLLWYGGEIVVIDVSQAVDVDHPRAMDFLRGDCKNMTDFFGGVDDALTTRELFDFVMSPEGGDADGDIDEAVEAALAADRRLDDDDDAVFMATHIPRSLHELGAGRTCEREQTELEEGRREEAFEQAVSALLSSTTTTQQADYDDEDEDEDDDEDDDEDEDDEDDDEEVCAEGRLPSEPGQRALAKQMKKAATKVAKEARAERRKSKLKKHLKKKAVRRAKRGGGG
ncbi:hypothetical protein CTAYLR_006494 [Chrysophaeum taylorii]|uniref:Serine/threonine-protein kinase RIO1 n=1 Tax=Chrysophaeum taylorii TaxID=2483200 RepID=A0AAD7ULT4_9STRA|nr:hypothetical protein CTAYLR_006494 [Chrysophaeum taylorii]